MKTTHELHVDNQALHALSKNFSDCFTEEQKIKLNKCIKLNSYMIDRNLVMGGGYSASEILETILSEYGIK